jgi:hypothetical protein
MRKLKPKIYKKSLFIGEKKIITFTKHGINKALIKIFFFLLLLMILSTMVLQGFVLFVQGTPNP